VPAKKERGDRQGEKREDIEKREQVEDEGENMKEVRDGRESG
tara:strand:+ start:133 stop:258 length:126 start_codon:yes stop_codon:yes gene_type:complete